MNLSVFSLVMYSTANFLISVLFNKFKVLEVLARSPVAAPLEAGLGEEAEAEIIVVDLVREVPRAVAVVCGGGGLDEARAVVAILVIGIVEGVDVDGQPPGMFRQLGAARDDTVAEAR